MSAEHRLRMFHTMAGPPSVTKWILVLSALLVQTLSILATGNGHDKQDKHDKHNNTETTTFLFDRREMLTREKLVPDVLDSIPEEELFVSFYSCWINMGNLVSASAASYMPTVLDWTTVPGAYYTVVMTGPDCPTQKNHTDREYLHWMVTNIKGTKFMDGETMAEYIGPAPTYVKEAHRFLFVVFKQPEPAKKKFNEEPIFDAFPYNEKRLKFSTRNFAKKNGLVPIAANYFWIDLDKPVPTFEPWFRTPDFQ